MKSSVSRVRKKRNNVMLTKEHWILIVRVYCGTNSPKRVKEAFETDFPNTGLTVLLRLQSPSLFSNRLEGMRFLVCYSSGHIRQDLQLLRGCYFWFLVRHRLVLKFLHFGALEKDGHLRHSRFSVSTNYCKNFNFEKLSQNFQFC